MKQRIMVSLLAAAIAISAAGCGNSTTNTEQTSMESAASEAQTNTASEADASEAVTAESTVGEADTASGTLTTLDEVIGGFTASECGTIQYRGKSFTLGNVTLKEMIDAFGLTLLTDDENINYDVDKANRNNWDFSEGVINAQTDEGAVIQLYFWYPLSDTADGITPNYDKTDEMLVSWFILGNDFFLEENLNRKSPDELVLNGCISTDMAEDDFASCFAEEPNKTITETNGGTLATYIGEWDVDHTTGKLIDDTSDTGSEIPDMFLITASFLDGKMVYLQVEDPQIGDELLKYTYLTSN